MKKKDIFSNCQQLRSEIEGIRRNLRGTETDLSQTQSEIQQLENAKIATRLEFGQASDIETVQTTENALREINNTLDAKRVERERLTQSLRFLRTELANLEATFNSLGCSNIV